MCNQTKTQKFKAPTYLWAISCATVKAAASPRASFILTPQSLHGEFNTARPAERNHYSQLEIRG